MSAHTRPTTYVPGAFLRQCDVCGIRFLSDGLVRGADGKFRCKKWCVEITGLEVDKLKAQSHKRKEAPPPPHATPWVRGDFASEEAAIFQMLAEKQVVDTSYPGGTVRQGLPPIDLWGVIGPGGPLSSASYSVQSAAWTCIYLGAVVAENRRPTSWMTSAKKKIRELGDWLLTQQLARTGTGDNYLTDSTLVWYGGWLRVLVTEEASFATLYSEDVGAGCMALTRAYQATGDRKYLNAAELAVVCINRLMNGDKLINYPTSSTADGATPWHAGMVTHQVKLVPDPGDPGGPGDPGEG